jgi:beta-glucosidase/6-phospho-beta-glucosidase/beta-galactosidase
LCFYSPQGFSNKINEKGAEYYDKLIDELLKHNIQPMVTLYHMDLPQYLQDLGGWANDLSATWFEDYARVVFDRYASKVKYWVTINQPNDICVSGYGYMYMAPGVDMKGIADYLCIKNVMVAHARAYRLYEKEYKQKYNGEFDNYTSLSPTLIPLGGVGTTCFSSCCDKDSAIIFTTGRLPDTGVGANDCKCNRDQRLHLPSEARRSSR